MADPLSKLDPTLRQQLGGAGDEDEVEALVRPTRLGGSIEGYLSEAKGAGHLDYRVLELAGCISVKASKKVILDIAKRDDVVRLDANPRFSAG